MLAYTLHQGVDGQMSISDDCDRDTALAALAHACDQLGLPDRPSAQANGQPMPQLEAKQHVRGAKPMLAESRQPSWWLWSWGTKIAATFGLTLLSIAAIAWVSFHARLIPTPTANATTDVSTKPALSKDIGSTFDAGGSQPSQQANGGAISASPLTAPKEAEQRPTFLDVRQQIDELRSSQSQLTLANAALAQRLKSAVETAQNNADRIEELKATQTQLVSEREGLTAQLKADQEQVVDIAAQLKSAQDQAARLAEQKSRPKAIAPTRQSVVNYPQKPARPAPSQLRLPLRTSSGQLPH
jgi:hypothetical protein